MAQRLHIVSFNIPYPPNYGGVIDVFYKIKALAALGAEVTLHCYEYGREPAPELAALCKRVAYYPRKKLRNSISLRQPYIVKSRRSDAMLADLLQDDDPILFEGLHTCYYLGKPELDGRITLVRMHNIEWEYYLHLSIAERDTIRKLYFENESRKLRQFEKRLEHTDHILPISAADTDYYSKKFETTTYLPAFHANDEVTALPGRGEYALYHGNLGVPENHNAVSWLIKEVFAELEFKLVVAGLDPGSELISLIDQHPNVALIANPKPSVIDQLIRDAHINTLPTFQSTGVKLKLINTLYLGRYVVVSPEMVKNTRLGALCLVVDSASQFREIIKQFMFKDFDKNELDRRSRVMGEEFSNQRNANRLLELLATS